MYTEFLFYDYDYTVEDDEVEAGMKMIKKWVGKRDNIAMKATLINNFKFFLFGGRQIYCIGKISVNILFCDQGNKG